MPLRIIFMGTPEFSVPTLSALVVAGHDVVAVYTQPPRPSGRGMGEKKSAIHVRAEELSIKVYTPNTLKTPQAQSEFSALNADIAVVVAYGLLLPQPILDAPRLGCYNGHASLLPRWRGAAPIQRAIEAGDEESGVMIMQMEAGLDTGPVLMHEKTPITPDMTAGELHDVLSALTAKLMVEAMKVLEAGAPTLILQSVEGVTYANKITKAETRIDWDRPVSQVQNHICAMAPYPGAWCEMELGSKPTRVKILRSETVEGKGKPGEVLDQQLTIACNEGAIRPSRLQKAGKQPCDQEEFLRGNPVAKGTVLS